MVVEEIIVYLLRMIKFLIMLFIMLVWVIKVKVLWVLKLNECMSIMLLELVGCV